MSVPFQEVNRELSGRRVAQELRLEPASESHKFACVACDSPDGLHAYPKQGGGAHCFSCWTTFSAVDLAVAALGLIPVEACRWLADRFGIRSDSPYRRSRKTRTQPKGPAVDPKVLRLRAEVYGDMVATLCLGPGGRAYLESRALNPDFAAVQGLRSIDSPKEWTELVEHLSSAHSMEHLQAAGFAREDGKAWLPWRDKPPAILICYFSRTGQVEAIRFRRMTDGDKRYMVPLRAGARIPWRAEAFDGPCPLDLVITEGELDALSLLGAGYDSTALGGATPSRALLKWVVEAVGHVSSIALWTDADAAGDGAVDRLARLLTEHYGWAWVESHVVRWRSTTDANDMAASGKLH